MKVAFDRIVDLADTYTKVYLCDGDRRFHKRKTAAAMQSCNPVYRQAVKYLACDAR